MTTGTVEILITIAFGLLVFFDVLILTTIVVALYRIWFYDRPVKATQKEKR